MATFETEAVVLRGIRYSEADLVQLTGRYTVPQILIDDRPVGGYDDIKALDDQGRLDPLLGLA